jgi:hypothetical protein
MNDFVEDRKRLGFWLGVKFSAQCSSERMIELDRRAATSGLAVKPHHAARSVLVQRIKRQEPQAGLCCALGLSALAQQHHEASKCFYCLVARPCLLRPAPRGKLLTFDVEPSQELSSVEARRRLELGAGRLSRKTPEGKHIDVESRDIEDNVVFVRGNDAVIHIVERLAEPPDAGAQVVQRGLVDVLAPEECHELPARLAAIRAEGEIGQQHALALSRQ